MKVIGFWLCFVMFLISAHRLPAPIQEVPESPTPAPAAAPTAQPKKSPARPKAKPSPESSPKAQTKASVVPQKGPARFAGAWRGTLAFGIAGDLHLTLVVNNEGNSVTESGGLVGTITFKATNDGKTVRWHSGVVGEIAWAVTPNPDGRTALLTAKSPFIGSPLAIFRKGAP